MLDVKKNNIDSQYIDSYWKNNLIMDQSKNKLNKDTKTFNEDSLHELKEKLNKNYKNKTGEYNNEYRKTYNDNFRYTDTYKSNNTGTNNQYNFRERYSRKQDSNSGMYIKEKSSEYRTFQKYSNTCENKRKMPELSEKCRIHEYNLRERKVLLDSFSKPKLI